MKIACAGLAFALAASLTAAAADSDSALPRSAPEAQGLSSSAILAFLEAAEAEVDALHSLMVVRRGHVVAEGWWAPYRPEEPHVLFSLTKSFTSTAIGLAVAEGRVSLDDTLISIFPEDAPAEPSENLQQMRVRDLLSMSTGHHAEAIEGFPYFEPTDVPLVRVFLELPVAHRPGTHFVYNTPASQILAAVVEKVTGEPLRDYLGPRLFEPLGIEDSIWLEAGDGVTLGGFGLSIRTRDIARFGQLYLRRGEWQGESLLPPAWVDQATARQVSNGSDPADDWNQGYGFQFWRSKHGNYRGDGAFGQYAIVLPEHDAVVAMTSGVGNMQTPLNLVWEHLIGGMEQEALPPDPEAHGRLERKLGSLVLATPEGAAESALSGSIAGVVWEFPDNDDGVEAVSLRPGPERDELIVRLRGREHTLAVGRGEWVDGGTLPLPGFGAAEEPVAASGAWDAEDRYRVEACLYRTPFCARFDLRFRDGSLALDRRMNVGFGPTERPQLVGRPAAEG